MEIAKRCNDVTVRHLGRTVRSSQCRARASALPANKAPITIPMKTRDAYTAAAIPGQALFDKVCVRKAQPRPRSGLRKQFRAQRRCVAGSESCSMGGATKS